MNSQIRGGKMKCTCMKVYSLSDQRADTKNMAGWETLEEKRFIYQRHWFGKEEVGKKRYCLTVRQCSPPYFAVSSASDALIPSW